MASMCLEGERVLLASKIDEKSRLLFRSTDDGTQLEFMPVYTCGNRIGGRSDKVRPTIQAVKDLEHLYALRKASKHQSQLFIIRHETTWGKLKICRSFFEALVEKYEIFPRFWNYMFSFGRRRWENEFGFSGFQSRRYFDDRGCANGHEFSYILRRVELNGRELSDGQSPWSIRQTAVYHKVAPSDIPDSAATPESHPVSTFLLVAPSSAAEVQISNGIKSAHETETTISPWYIHWMLMTDSLRGWKDYMAWVEKKLKEQTDKILLARLAVEDGTAPQQQDGNITFLDRQYIHELEECTINIKMILATMSDNIWQVRDQCKEYCLNNPIEQVQNHSYFLDEFEGYVRETEMYVQRAGFLSQKVQSTAQMLSNLLDYEEAKALKDLGLASQRDGKVVSALTFKGTRDAAAVKVLTIISLIYLPTTIVANFFSTTFVHTNDDGKMQVSTEVWILAAISIPLTCVTVVLWWMCVRLSTIAAKSLDKEFQLPQISRQIPFLNSSIRRKLSANAVDVEMGTIPSSSKGTLTWGSSAPSPSTIESGWSNARTLKD